MFKGIRFKGRGFRVVTLILRAAALDTFNWIAIMWLQNVTAVLGTGDSKANTRQSKTHLYPASFDCILHVLFHVILHAANPKS